MKMWVGGRTSPFSATAPATMADKPAIIPACLQHIIQPTLGAYPAGLWVTLSPHSTQQAFSNSTVVTTGI